MNRILLLTGSQPNSAALLITSGVIEAAVLILAAVVGAMLQARFSKRQTLELDTIQRRRQALLEFLKHLRVIRLAVESVLAGEAEPQSTKWVAAAKGMPKPYVREIPMVHTWLFSDEPDVELQKWDSIVLAVHAAEREWQDRIAVAVQDDELESMWREVSYTGFHMAMETVDVRAGAHRIRNLLPALLDRINQLLDLPLNRESES